MWFAWSTSGPRPAFNDAPPPNSSLTEDASSVGFRTGVVYALGLLTAARFLLHRWGFVQSAKFRR